MSAYDMPAEPDVKALWTLPISRGAFDPEDAPTRWTRSGTMQHGETVWTSPDLAPATWAGLLRRGRVFDTHPDLDGVSPLPWAHRWLDDEEPDAIVDAEGLDVRLDNASRSLIVRAVNAYAAQVAGGAS